MENKRKTIDRARQYSGILAEVLKQERAEIKACRILKEYENHSMATSTLQEGRESIRTLIDSNRGGSTGMHGFIGERAQVYISNAKSIAEGKETRYRLLDDGSPIDYMRDDVPIQQKACNSGGTLSLDQVLKHSSKYPFFNKQGGVYQIPKDHYRTYMELRNMPREEAGKLLKHDFGLWKRVHSFTDEHPDIRLEPMVVSYDEIQAGKIGMTLDMIEKDLMKEHQDHIRQVVDYSKASFFEGMKVTAFSAAFEGTMDGLFCSVEKVREGKTVFDFTEQDWKDIGWTTAKGSGKGALRGAATYILVNAVNISGPIASAGITTSFKVAEDIKDYCDNGCSTEQIRARVGEHLIEGAVSAGSTLAAMALCARVIPISAPYGKAVQICAGLAGNYIGCKGASVLKEFIKERKEDGHLNNIC
jgi:hypothetical protein